MNDPRAASVPDARLTDAPPAAGETGIETGVTSKSADASAFEEKLTRELHPPLRLVPKSERAKEQYRAHVERYEVIRRQQVWKKCLTILVHGPGNRSEDHRDLHNKRIEIVNILRNPPRDQDANICEELVAGDDWRDQELDRARASDLVLILTGSSAPAVEFGDLINHEDVLPKMITFIAKSEEKSYLGTTALAKLGPARVLFFDYPADLVSCILATRAIRLVEDHLLGSIIKQIQG